MEYVQSEAHVSRVAERWSGEPLLAVDTEAAGYHRFDDRVCLVQLSTRSATVVIDALAVNDLEALRPLFDSAETEVVLHDAAYDLRLLSRDFDLGIRHLFDTKIAAQFLGERAIGLASLLKKHLDVKLEKRYQLADWARRPLPDEMLEYAAEDTRHLPVLRDLLRSGLEEGGRLAWAQEEFRLQEGVRWTEDDTEPYLQLKGANRLDRRGLAVLREVYAWREERARERDTARFRIISNRALVALAKRPPETRSELASIRGVRSALVRKHGDAILAAVERARSLPEDRLPERATRSRRPPRDPEFDRRVDRMRAARSETAEALAMDPGFLMPRSQLKTIAREMPRTPEELAEVPGVRHWQVEAVGDPVLAALHAE